MFDSYDTAVTLIAIMIAVAGIMLGLGYALDHRKLKELGKSELMQCAVNGAIVGSLLFSFGPFGFMTGLINNITSGSGASASCQPYMQDNAALCFAYAYLTGPTTVTISGSAYPTLTMMSLGLLIPLSIIDAAAGVIGSMSFNLNFITFGLGAASAPFLAQLKYMTGAITLAFLGVQIQGMLLSFIAAVAIPILLPVGIVLRTFYFTRGLGGTIIALAIGLYVIFPMTYLLDAQLSNQYYQSAFSALNSYQLRLSSAQAVIGAISISSNSASNSILPIGGIIGSMQNLASFFTAGTVDVINKLVDTIAYLVIEVFFIPLLSIMLTFVSTRELAKILGSEISFGRFDVF